MFLGPPNRRCLGQNWSHCDIRMAVGRDFSNICYLRQSFLNRLLDSFIAVQCHGKPGHQILAIGRNLIVPSFEAIEKFAKLWQQFEPIIIENTVLEFEQT